MSPSCNNTNMLKISYLITSIKQLKRSWNKVSKHKNTLMPAKQSFGQYISLQLSAESLVTREIEERIHKQAANKTNNVIRMKCHLTARQNTP